ncbi:hypothetical protein ACU4GD_41395 [Cupriavidus basilensis]
MLDAFGTDSRDDYIGGFPSIIRIAASKPSPIAGRPHAPSRQAPAARTCWKTAVPGGWWPAPAWCIRSARAGGRPAWKLPAVAEPARRRQDDGAVVPRPAGRCRAHRGTAERGATVRCYGGGSRTACAGAVTRPVTEPLYLDVTLPAGQSFSQCAAGRA